MVSGIFLTMQIKIVFSHVLYARSEIHYEISK